MHAFVEFGNRLVGGVVITLTLVTWLAARRTPGLPGWARRVALLVFLGALAQAPMGYLAVASDLRWPVVTAHLLLSIALLAGAVVVAVEALRAARRPLSSGRPARAAASRPRFHGRRASCSSSAAPSRPPRARTREAASTSTASGSSSGACTSTVPSSVSFCSRSCFAIGYLAAYRDRSPALFKLGARRSRRCCSCRWRSGSFSGARSSRGGSFSSTSCSLPPSGRAPLPWRHCSSGRLGRCFPAST